MTSRSLRLSLVFALAGAALDASSTLAQEAAPTPVDAARTVVGAGAPEHPEDAALVPGGLTADEAARRAIASSASLRRADAVVRIAEAGSMQAFAAVLPQLTLQGRATYTNRIVNNLASVSAEQQMVIDNQIAGISLDPTNDSNPAIAFLLDSIVSASANLRFPYYRSQYEFSAQLAYPVTAAVLTLLPTYRAMGRQVDAARIQRDIELAQIGLRAREAFYEHVRARGARVVAVEARDAVRAHRDQVQALVEAGVAARADLLQVEAQLASAEVAVTNAGLGVEISARALALLMTGDGEEAPEITIGEDVSVPVGVPEGGLHALEERALQHRPELVALELTASARRMEARAQSFARYPQLAVAGNVQYANPNNRYIPMTREFRTTWDISAVLSWSPNDMLVAEGRRRVAAAQAVELEEQQEQLRQGVRLEVTQAYQGLLTARASLASTEAAVAAATESYRVRTEQLAQGTIVATELADARTALTRAELERVDAAVQMRIARARLSRALGEDTAAR